MKKKYNILILFSCLIFYSSNIIGQATNCGTSYFEGLMSTNDPNYSTRNGALEAHIQDSISYHHFDSLFARSSDITFGVTRIPVVVHVIGDDAASAVNSFAIQQAINDLNDLFRKKSNTAGYGLGVDTEIEFCLAIKDETGFTISGINLVPDGSHGDYGPFGMTDQDDVDIKTPTNVIPSRWSPSKYLNIWICDLGNSTKKVWGSAPTLYLPVASKKYRDGVVIDMNNFSAKLLAHGIGHWLNLRHTYGDDGSTCGSAPTQASPNTPLNTDHCSDTPWCTGSASGWACNTLTDQCPVNNTPPINNRQIANYMDDSPTGCMNMFTLQQKNRMQSLFTLPNGRPDLKNNSIASCVAQPTCYDGLQNGTETGVDCGGQTCAACPICKPSVNFKINGHTTHWWDIVTVCNADGAMMLSPINPTCQFNNYIWDYVPISFDGPTSPAVNGEGELPYGGFGYLFISIQECDVDRNPIGQESGTWFNISPYVQTSLNLHHFIAYLGNPLAPGKYFRILIEGRRQKHIAFIKVFEPNVTLSNVSVTNAQVGDNIFLNGCTISSLINVVATNKIEITSSSALTAGSYFINTITCNNMSGFRHGNNSPGKNFENSDDQLLNFKESLKVRENRIVIAPNPNNGNFTIIIDEKEGNLRSIEIQNALGVIVQTITAPSNTTEINIQNQPSGLYLVKLNFVDKTVTKKMIKQ